MDFKDFFPSIVPDDLIKHIERYLKIPIPEDDKTTIGKIFFYKNKKEFEGLKLSIGAPTSPKISNTIMYDFDLKINELCKNKNVVYTRYADDISFSTNKKNVLKEIEQAVYKILKEIEYPNIQINGNKTKHLSKKSNRHITGLVLSNDNKVSIGRKKKRYIKSLAHKFVIKNINDEEMKYLSGYLSFCKSVEEEFIESLKNKYGNDVVNKLIKFDLYNFGGDGGSLI